jgi:hypothetical protein
MTSLPLKTVYTKNFNEHHGDVPGRENGDAAAATTTAEDEKPLFAATIEL